MGEGLYSLALKEWANRKEFSHPLTDPQFKLTVNNPLCGDRVTVELKTIEGKIQSISFQVRGCLLCKASCFYLASIAKGLDLMSIKKMRLTFEKSLKEQTGFLKSHQMFWEVKNYKSRHSCVLLPYDAIIKAFPK